MELCPGEDAGPAYYASQAAYNEGVMGGPRKRIYHGPRAVINTALTHQIRMYRSENPASGNGGTSKTAGALTSRAAGRARRTSSASRSARWGRW